MHSMDRALSLSVGAVATAVALVGCAAGTRDTDRATARPAREFGVVVPPPPAAVDDAPAAAPSPTFEPLPPAAAAAPSAAAAPPSAARPASPLPNVVRFGEDAYLPGPGADAVLRAHAERLKADPTRRLLLKGHGDGHGSVRYNRALAEKRAEMVARALRREGVSPRQLTVIGIGDDTDPNAPEVRRVFLIER